MSLELKFGRCTRCSACRKCCDDFVGSPTKISLNWYWVHTGTMSESSMTVLQMICKLSPIPTPRILGLICCCLILAVASLSICIWFEMLIQLLICVKVNLYSKCIALWSLGILSWLNTSLNIKTLKTGGGGRKILKLAGRLPVILTGENILVFPPLSAAQHGFCGYLRNWVLEWFHFQAGLRFPKLSWLKTSLKR